MKTAIVPASEVAATGRLDAAFHVLLAEQKELVEALLERLDADELGKLALALPFDQSAADTVWPRAGRHRTEAELRATVGGGKGPTRFYTQRNLALYVAAASQFAVSKMLEEVYRITLMKKTKVEQIQALLATPKMVGVPAWDKALKRSSADAGDQEPSRPAEAGGV